MFVLRPETWPGVGRRSLSRWRRFGRLRTPVLVVSAALFGAALSAAVMVGFWDNEVRHRQAVEAKLATSEQRAGALAAANANLRGGLDESRAISARLAQSSARLRTQAKTLLAENAKLVATAGGLHGQGGSLERRAVSVSKLTSALGSDVVSVLAYVTNTNLGSLDPSYLQAQLDYLKPAIARIQAVAEALGADTGSYAAAVERFAAQAAAYSTALRRLAARTS